MNKSQPQYIIEANARCKTHPRGCRIVYTGPRANVPRGWTVIGRA